MDTQTLENVRFYFQRILVPIIVSVGVLGNILSVVVLTRKRMRCSTTIYLTGLAVADITYLLAVLILSFRHYPSIHDIKFALFWKTIGLTHWICDATNYISIYITVSFTVERYIAVCHPIKGQVLCTESKAKKVIAVVVILCLLLTCSTSFEYELSESKEYVHRLTGVRCNSSRVSTTDNEKTFPKLALESDTSKMLVESSQLFGPSWGNDDQRMGDDNNGLAMLLVNRISRYAVENEIALAKTEESYSGYDSSEYSAYYATSEAHRPSSDLNSNDMEKDDNLPIDRKNVDDNRSEKHINNNKNPQGRITVDGNPYHTTSGGNSDGGEKLDSNFMGPIIKYHENGNVNDSDSSLHMRHRHTIDDDCLQRFVLDTKQSALANNRIYRDVFFGITAIVFTFIPIVLLMIFNYFLITVVRRSNNLRRTMTNNTSSRQIKKMKSISSENRMTIILIGVVILFIMCQIPGALHLLVEPNIKLSTENEKNMVLALGNICNLLVAINSASNFILYCALSDKYRMTIKNFLLRRRKTLRQNTLTSSYFLTRDGTVVQSMRQSNPGRHPSLSRNGEALDKKSDPISRSRSFNPPKVYSEGISITSVEDKTACPSIRKDSMVSTKSTCLPFICEEHIPKMKEGDSSTSLTRSQSMILRQNTKHSPDCKMFNHF